MSSKRWPAGSLRAALIKAHEAEPHLTAPELARRVGCDPGSARVVLRGAGIQFPRAKPQRVVWTPPMKEALIQGAHARTPIYLLAERLGVAPQTMILGAMEIIAEGAPA